MKTVADLCQDWDYADPVGPESLLFTGLGMESLDAVVLCTAIQEHYRITMPFAELLADIGQKQRDLSIAELAEFVNQHVGAGTPREQAVECGAAAVRGTNRKMARSLWPLLRPLDTKLQKCIEGSASPWRARSGTRDQSCHPRTML